ncbi:MAG: DUF2905 domain-containing protein [Nitrospinota bacterium]|nr:MAG: DUF2905 domain-containing protein [Nitrospinota bacterium]
MPEFSSFGKLFILIGCLFIIIGSLILLAGKVPWLGRLPGDIVYERGNFRFYFPLATSILLSIVLTLLLNLLLRK